MHPPLPATPPPTSYDYRTPSLAGLRLRHCLVQWSSLNAEPNALVPTFHTSTWAAFTQHQQVCPLPLLPTYFNNDYRKFAPIHNSHPTQYMFCPLFEQPLVSGIGRCLNFLTCERTLCILLLHCFSFGKELLGEGSVLRQSNVLVSPTWFFSLWHLLLNLYLDCVCAFKFRTYSAQTQRSSVRFIILTIFYVVAPYID